MSRSLYPAPVTFIGVLFAAQLIVGFARAQTTALSPEGVWWADQGAARVELREVQGKLEGRIIWLRAPFGLDGCPLRDRNNPEPELRSRSVLGMRIIWGLEPDSAEPGRWVGGSVYEPNSGRTFRLRIELEAPSKLLLRGFIGLEWIGQTQTWYRVATSENEPRCGTDSEAQLGGSLPPLESWLNPKLALRRGGGR